MGLPQTLVVPIGTPVRNVTFTQTSESGTSAVYHAPSPQDDIQGKIRLDIRHETVKNGNVRSNVKITTPIYDSDRKVYTGAMTESRTTQRPAAMKLPAVGDSVDTMTVLYGVSSNAVRDCVVNATV